MSRVREEQVVQALASSAHFSLERLSTLLSPAASSHLEEMAHAAQALTRARFGRTMQLYAPLYLSSFCSNQCRYCGFNLRHTIDRKRLSLREAVEEAQHLAEFGFRDLLLVSGEDPACITVEYLVELALLLKDLFSSISVEIYPLVPSGYEALFKAGIEGVTLYQETYDPEVYGRYHLGGPKADYGRRLTFQEGAAQSGMRRLGLGVLLGLADWRSEALALGLHARLLMKHHWRSRISFSFPRIRPADEVDLDLPFAVNNHEMVQMILALRLCFPDAGMTLSTRESSSFRDHLIPLGFTQISAGSSTAPGGYGLGADAEGREADNQFAVADERSVGEVAALLVALGYEPVWKDWDRSF